MARPKKTDAKTMLGVYVDPDLADKLEILCERYDKKTSELVRMLIRFALKSETFTPTELAVQASSRALRNERGSNVVDLREINDLEEVQRRWRDSNPSSAKKRA